MLKKFDFGQNFINWIENLLKDQKSCIINGGKATPYFTLQRGSRQGDPVLSILFILSLELLFPSIKKNSEIQGIEIFDHFYFWSAYANYTTFFLKNENSIGLFAKTFEIFCQFSGLKPNVSKWKIEGISTFKGIPMAVYGMKSIDLATDFIKNLGTCFSFNQKIEEEVNPLCTISSIQSLLKLWKIINLALEEKIVILKP